MADNSETIVVKYVAEVEGLKAGLKSVQASVTELAKSNEELQKKLGDAFEKPAEKVQSLKSRLKELKAQLAEATDPKEVERLAKAAGALTDQLQDAGDAAKVFASESKFEQIGTALGGVGGKLRNLDFKGALDQSKLLVSATKGLTFKEGAKGIKDLGATLGNVGKALLTNPIFLLGAAIALIVTNFEALTKAGGLVGNIFGSIKEAINGVVKGFQAFTDSIGLTDSKAASLREYKKVLDEIKVSAKEGAKAVADSIEQNNIKILQNLGKISEKEAKIQQARIDKQKAIDELEKKQRQAVTDALDKLGISADSKRLKDVEKREKVKNDIEFAYIQEAILIRNKYESDIALINSEAIAKEREANKKAAEEKQKKEEEAWTKLKETRDKALKEMGTLTPLTISSLSAQSQEKTQKDLEEKTKKSQESITKNFKAESDKRDAAAASSAKNKEKQEDKNKKAFNDTVQIAQETLSILDTLSKQRTERELADAQERTDKQNELYKEQLDNNLISKKRYDQLVERQNKKFAAEEQKLKKEAFERDKSIAITNAIIQTALNVVKAYGEGGPAGIILAALAAAAGAIQIAAIENAPPPKFEKGGKVNGNRHFAGGTLIEAEKDEFVINRKEALKHDKLLEAINNGRADKYIHEMYLAPVLKQTAKRIREQQSKDFASNIASSMMLQNEFKDVNILDSLKMSRQNDKEIAHYIVKHINPNINKYNW